MFVWHGQVWRRVGGTAQSQTLIRTAADPYLSQAHLGSLSRTGLGILAVGVIGLVAAAALMNKDLYANPFADQ